MRKSQTPTPESRKQVRRGAILLEVVLALALLVMTSAVILGSMSAAMRSAGRLRLRAQAADLAVTLASELHMGLLAPADTELTPYARPGLAGWSWQVAAEPLEGAPAELRRVLLTVRHDTGVSITAVGFVPTEELGETAAAGGTTP